MKRFIIEKDNVNHDEVTNSEWDSYKKVIVTKTKKGE